MTREHPDIMSAAPLSNPRRLLYASAGAAGIAVMLALPAGVWVPLRVLCIGVAVLAAARAVVVQPRSPRIVASAAALALVCGSAMDGSWLQLLAQGKPTPPPGLIVEDDWDTARLVMRLLAMVGFFATFLLLLPFVVGKLYLAYIYTFQGERSPKVATAEERGQFAGWVLTRAIISVLVVLHFIGIGAAVMAVPAGQREQSWLAQQIWQRWQPYLQFMYLNNAYRFYSPEPGPPSMLWFRVEYTDGSFQWVRLPTHGIDDQDPLAVEFTRRLSLGESVNQLVPVGSVPLDMKRRRQAAGNNFRIGKHPELPLDFQYRRPMESCIRLLPEYARYIGRAYPSTDPNVDVAGIKIYRVVHHMLEPRQMSAPHLKPTDPWTYFHYYQGEFTKDGELMDPDDPFLYWLIPIYAWPQGAKPPDPFEDVTPGMMYLEAGPVEVIDFMKTHEKIPTRKRGGGQP
ncbi:MAG: hypothetical protein K2R98_11395 [Gemmataceae bacterium]|nr:hypothetical protein [Gemmataceae bacterium]